MPEPIPLPEGLEVEIIRPIELTAEAHVVENDPAFRGVEVSPDRLVFAVQGELARPLEPGQVVAGKGGPRGYLRRILSVAAVPEGRLEAVTEPAQLTDLIASGHFVVRYTPPRGSGDLTEGEVGGAREALDSTGGAVALLNTPVLGLRCGAGARIDASVRPWLDLDYTFELEVDIDWERRFLVVPKPALALFRLELGGSLSAGVEVEGTGGWDAICQLDVVEIASAGRDIGIELGTLAFSIGPVPVVITNEVEPLFNLDVDHRVEPSSFSYRAEAGFGLTVGVTYDGDDWSPVWEPEAWADGAYEAGGPGAVSVTDRIAAGLEYQARIYDLAGPNVGLEAFAEASGGTGLDLCSWSFDVDSGITATLGGELEVDTPVVDWTIAEIMIGEVDLLRSTAFTGSGTYPWCDDCTSEVRCMDDLGRDVCPGDRGVLECTGGTQVCTCTAEGTFTDCGGCIAS